MKLVNLVAAGLAAVAAFTMSSAAVAADVVIEGRPTARVSYADLDIASKTGLAALKGRVRAAATQLCGANSLVMQERSAAEKCRDAAIEGAQDQIAFAARRAADGTALAAATQGGAEIAISLR